MLCFSHQPRCMPSVGSLDKVSWPSVFALHWMPAEVIMTSLKALTASYNLLRYQAKLCGVQECWQSFLMGRQPGWQLKSWQHSYKL